MAETVLALRDITVRHGDQTVLNIPNLDVVEGDLVGILGANGAGKTTLLRVMGLLLRPTTGKMFFTGEEATRKNTLLLRRHTASVFQEPLFLNGTVYENVALGLKFRNLGSREIEKRVQPWLERLGIARLATRPARTLSGGEAQRTSLARAFVLDPRVLLLDEPFSSLDQPTREALLGDLQRIFKITGVTTIFVTHERQEVLTLSSRAGVLSRGKLLQFGPTLEVFTRPENEDVAKIVGHTPNIGST